MGILKSRTSDHSLRATVALFVLGAAPAILAFADAPRISITFDSSVSDQPYTGRVFVMTTRRERGRPIDGPSWFGAEPFFAIDVRNWKPGESLDFDASRTLGFPAPLSELPAGKYRIQAAMDLNGWSHEVVSAPGNGYSDITTLEHVPAHPQSLKLTITQKIEPLRLEDTDRLKYVRLKSKLLSDFHKRDVFMNAAVALPEAYAESTQRFPAVYTIPGFGGTIRHAGRSASTRLYEAVDFDAVVVYLDPDCPTGHHVFADSANNGPCGEALIREFIPHLEREFRLIPEAQGRFLTGHSSGGWSSLWLQVAYPDVFGGVWSTSPDPVDFTAFQTINIHSADENFFAMPDGSPRPLSRGDWGKPLMCRGFCDMEHVLGRGGQLQSFEAVFSPRGADGQPLKLWDRSSGALDRTVAEAWRKYDIREQLESRWNELGPKLRGKLHIFCGDKDTFYLEPAVLKLREALKRLGSDAQIEMIAGAGHGLPPSVFAKCARQMAEKFAAQGAPKQREK